MKSAALLVLMTLCALVPAEARQSGSVAQGPAALAALKAAAEKGTPEAQLEYAKALSPKPESRAWAQKAADQGLAEAWFWLGYTMSGDGTPFYEKAAEKGYAKAFDYLLDNLLFRAGDKADVVKARKFGDLARKFGVNLGFDGEKVLATIDRCFEAGAPAIPASDRPNRSELAAFGKVDDCAPYLEGIGRNQDLRQYRACVLSQDPVDNNAAAELYANGWGVKRNARLAIALVCHGSDVPAELIGMVETLYATRNQAELGNDFLFCDHVTSGKNQGACSARAEGIESARRGIAIGELTANWPLPHKAALVKLQDAAAAFIDARSSNEVDMSGTARAAMAIGEEASLRDDMLDSLRAFEAGRLPAGLDYKAADAELNAVYSRIMKKPALDLGTITKDGIRATQIAWLAYRDAWAGFGVTRYPKVPSDTWKAWATAKRTAQLKELLQPEAGPSTRPK